MNIKNVLKKMKMDIQQHRIMDILIETTHALDKAKELMQQQNIIIKEQREIIELLYKMVETMEELNDINKKILPQPSIN